MRFQTLGNKSAFMSDQMRNSDSTLVTMKRGTQVYLTFNGTEDGFACILPSSASAAQQLSFAYGVVTDDVLAGQVGEARRHGLCNYILIAAQTRSASTNSFATVASLALGLPLGIDTVNNCFLTVASSEASAATLPIIDQYFGFLAQNVATLAGIASNTAATQLILYQGVKAFLRML